MHTQLQKIKKFCIQDGKIFFFQNEGNDLFIYPSKKKLNTEIISFNIFHNRLFCQKQNNLEIIDYEGKCLSIIDGRYFLSKSYSTKDFFYILKEDIENDFYYCFDKDTILKRVEWENNFVCQIFDDFFLSIKQYCLQLNNITIGENIWQTSFKDLVQSETVHTYPELIEHNQKLYFQLQSENRKGVFCIDVNTGKEITLYIDCYGFLIQDEDFVYTSKYENILCKINPKTNECEEWDVDELIKSNGFDSISDHRCVVEDGKVYFTQTLGDTKAKVGVLDTLNKTLIFKHEFEPKNGGISSIQVSEDRIFIHTQDNTLHIFEKE